jgi:membrane protein
MAGRHNYSRVVRTRKILMALYIGKQGLESTYGAAASIVVVLVWVYYSAQIVLFGAEFTNARAKQRALP